MTRMYLRRVKKTHIVQLFTGEGSIAKEVAAENIAATVWAFVILIGYCAVRLSPSI
jgi:hypothetical protein